MKQVDNVDYASDALKVTLRQFKKYPDTVYVWKKKVGISRVKVEGSCS
jgi:hypothetical protein